MVGVKLGETIWSVGWASCELVLDSFLSKWTDTRKFDCIRWCQMSKWTVWVSASAPLLWSHGHFQACPWLIINASDFFVFNRTWKWPFYFYCRCHCPGNFLALAVPHEVWWIFSCSAVGNNIFIRHSSMWQQHQSLAQLCSSASLMVLSRHSLSELFTVQLTSFLQGEE